MDGDYVLRVLKIFQLADNQDLFWRVDGENVQFYANCSDTFAWATGDAEEITAEDLPLLEQTMVDLGGLDESMWLSELFAARKRGCRPMREFMDSHMLPRSVAALFENCGSAHGQEDE